MEPHGRIQANGVDFAYLAAGPTDGPLALCLHGFPDHAPTFRHLLRALADAGWHAVAPWMRGYHPTGLAPDNQYQSATLSLDALALLGADEGLFVPEQFHEGRRLLHRRVPRRSPRRLRALHAPGAPRRRQQADPRLHRRPRRRPCRGARQVNAAARSY
jgi:hypothetical protein